MQIVDPREVDFAHFGIPGPIQKGIRFKIVAGQVVESHLVRKGETTPEFDQYLMEQRSLDLKGNV